MILFPNFTIINFLCTEIQPDMSSVGVQIISRPGTRESSVVLPSPVSLLRDWLC